MAAYIEASGCNWAMDFPMQMLDPKANKEECDFYITWSKANSTVLGSIKLHLLESLKAKYQPRDTALGFITALKAEYTAPGISGTFALFKELLDMKVAQPSHPAPSLNMAMLLLGNVTGLGNLCRYYTHTHVRYGWGYSHSMLTCTKPVPCKVRHYTQMSELPPTSYEWNPSIQKG